MIVHIIASAGSADVSGDINNVSVRWDKNNPDVTTFGDTTIQRISGLRDYSLDFAGIFTPNTGGSGALDAHSLMVSEMNASTMTVFRVAPAGSISGCPVYSGSALISSLQVTGPVNGPVAISFTLQSGAGSLTAACVA